MKIGLIVLMQLTLQYLARSEPTCIGTLIGTQQKKVANQEIIMRGLLVDMLK